MSRVIATWFGCGYAPVAPGTAGSAAALAIAIALGEWAGWPPWAFAALALLLAPAAIRASTREEKRRGRIDPGVIVVDEVVGQWITLAGATALNWKAWLAGFVLFRLFDIVKPFPAGRLQKLPGGWGIVADDVAAGVYGALVLWAAGCFNLY